MLSCPLWRHCNETMITPFLMHWNYCSLLLSHRDNFLWYQLINIYQAYIHKYLRHGLLSKNIMMNIKKKFSFHCNNLLHTVYPKKYAHGFCFAVLCCGYALTDFPISIRRTSLALWQSNDCLSASKATLMNMDKYFMWIHYERLHNHNKAKHNKTVCIFLGIYCIRPWDIIT